MKSIDLKIKYASAFIIAGILAAGAMTARNPATSYVRVATDILLIAIGTGMVIDAIDDLGR